MLDLIAQATPLPRRVFEGDPDFCIFGGAQYFVQPGHDLLQAHRFTRTQVRARMEDEKWQTKRFCKSNFLDERLQGFGTVAGRARAQIDQITRVSKHGGELEARLLLFKLGDVGGRMRTAEPLHIIFDKYLDDLAAHGRPAFQCFKNPAADRHVSTEYHNLLNDQPRL